MTHFFEEVIRLSTSYEKPTDMPELELICTIYNINPGKDRGLLGSCSVLDEYTQFVEAVRRFEGEEYEESVEKAIDYCIEHSILKDFLLKRRAEVLKAMEIDMRFEKREEFTREEERKLGQAEGKQIGKQELLDELVSDGTITVERAEEIRARLAQTEEPVQPESEK